MPTLHCLDHPYACQNASDFLYKTENRLDLDGVTRACRTLVYRELSSANRQEQPIVAKFPIPWDVSEI
jgi:hypothetical protein